MRLPRQRRVSRGSFVFGCQADKEFVMNPSVKCDDSQRTSGIVRTKLLQSWKQIRLCFQERERRSNAAGQRPVTCEEKTCTRSSGKAFKNLFPSDFKAEGKCPKRGHWTARQSWSSAVHIVGWKWNSPLHIQLKIKARKLFLKRLKHCLCHYS